SPARPRPDRDGRSGDATSVRVAIVGFILSGGPGGFGGPVGFVLSGGWDGRRTVAWLRFVRRGPSGDTARAVDLVPMLRVGTRSWVRFRPETGLVGEARRRGGRRRPQSLGRLRGAGLRPRNPATGHARGRASDRLGAQAVRYRMPR